METVRFLERRDTPLNEERLEPGQATI